MWIPALVVGILLLIVGGYHWTREQALTNDFYLRLHSAVPLGYIKEEGWSGALMHYYLWCNEHGRVITYPHGWEERLRCPACLKSPRLAFSSRTR